MNLKTALLDAKKALGVVAVTIPAAVAAGLIDNGQAATITGIVGGLTAVVVYLLKNEPTPPNGA